MGKDHVKLQYDELDIAKIINLVSSPKCGAISNFIGTTRDNFENKQVLKLEYEAYEPMAVKEIANICSKIRSQWNVEHIAIYHRLGNVPVSAASVVIAISSPHRHDSLQAVEFAINTLKASVPIWKKEVYDTYQPQWKENAECSWSNSESNNEFIKTIETSCKDVKSVIKTEQVDTEEMTFPVETDADLVQIRATSDELRHRIESFIERKRQQVNLVNVQEFCCQKEQGNDDEDSCARVDAILIRRKDSKSHVKVHRVSNTWGPQMADQLFLRKTTACTEQNNCNYSSVLDERISIAERILGIIKPVPPEIYQRLKNIEDRILFLEGISPEYKDFWVKETVDDSKGTFKPVRKRTYSMAELDSKLNELEDKYAKKMK